MFIISLPHQNMLPPQFAPFDYPRDVSVFAFSIIHDAREYKMIVFRDSVLCMLDLIHS